MGARWPPKVDRGAGALVDARMASMGESAATAAGVAFLARGARKGFGKRHGVCGHPSSRMSGRRAVRAGSTIVYRMVRR
jgi:hypothetical protein